MDVMINSFEEFEKWLDRYYENQREFVNHYSDDPLRELYKKKLDRIRAGMIMYVWNISDFKDLYHGKRLTHFAVNQALNENHWVGVPFSVMENSPKQIMTTILAYCAMAKLAQTA